ncbi:DUF1573 domain-containing protein, partial [Flavobacterium sp. DG2-3]|uniref:DUF7507 domain-containing protein n=1 Tax=Flavobacterium sp. DG2-3 TaxID=3068317 RepID=UPI00273E8DE5
MKKLYLLFTVLFFLVSGNLLAQEICNNGIDDDGDGYVDQYDPDCNAGPAPTCFAPAPAPNFQIKLALQGPANTLDTSVSPSIGDLDGDGIPEIIAPLGNSNLGYTTYRVVGGVLQDAGINFQLQVQAPVYGSVVQPAIADLDGDGTAEVVCVEYTGFVYVFSHTGGTTTTYEFKSDLPTNIVQGSPRIADINEDGVPEIIIGNQVFVLDLVNHTLKRLPVMHINYPFGRDGVSWGADPVVVDILPNNPGKEIVAGGIVYGVNMTTGPFVLKSLNAINSSIPLAADGPTAVADLDLDGDLDVAFSIGTRLYVWDPVGNAFLLNVPSSPAVRRSIPTISYVYNDITNNGMAVDYPEILVGYVNSIKAFNLQIPGNLVWDLATTDSSGETGISSFDFNGDGIQELVYNDETQIRIINGNTTTPVNLAVFNSGTETWMEHPVIADVDNDGQAEMVAFTGAARAGNSKGQINIFKSDGGTIWQPARKIWNQRGYHVININDDLTVPKQETKMNNFMPAGSTAYKVLNQYNVQFNPNNFLLEPGTVAAADVQLNSLQNFDLTTGQLTLNISVLGNLSLPAGTPITVYNGNPTTGPAAVVGTGYTSTAIASGTTQTMTITIPTVQSYRLYAIVNDSGSIPTPFNLTTDFPSTGIVECNYLNNIASIVPPVYDTDGDGKNDLIDEDADNDGILNVDESHGYDMYGDEDGDGILNFQDVNRGPGPGDGSLTDYTDSNGDGIADVFDTDGDGIIDAYDLDSDNDGCPDSNEFYEDSNADGGDGGQFGIGPDPVATFANGRVSNPAATYSGVLPPVFAAVTMTVATPMADQTATIGDNITFSSGITAEKVTNFYTTPVTKADATAELTYQWYVSTDGGTLFNSLPAETNATLNVNNVQLTNDQYIYRVVASHTGSSIGCSETVDEVLLRVPQDASLALVKTASVGTAVSAGDQITYTFTVTNTGNVPLSNVVIDDAKTGSTALAVNPSTIAPGASGNITATYTITQADLNAGSVSNTATATGTAPDTTTVTDISGTAQNNDTLTETTLTQSPAIAVVKTASVGGTGAVGDQITYTFNVTNTGNVNLSNVVIDDAKTGSVALAVSPSTIAPGASGSITAVYTITQADIDAGSVTNSATATGTAPNASTVNDTSGTAQNNNTPTETSLTQSPAIALVKTASIGGTGAVGDEITYTFSVTNTGNVSLTDIIIEDPMIGNTGLTLNSSSLAPGVSESVTATYTITQGDLDAGSVTNSATATGTAPNASTVSDTSGTATNNDDDTVTNLTQSPAIAVVKTAAVGGTGSVGDQITYTFDVTNTGNVTLSNVVIDDAKTGSTALAVSPSTIAPGGTGTITATYTITQADLNAGSVTNSATATGTAPNASTVSDTSGTALTNDDDTVTNLTQSPSIAVVKTASVGGTGAVGDQITYTFDVTNTGNVTLSNVVIDDAKTGSTALAVSPSTIVPGASGSITATYTITQADLNTGSVSNTATATGTAPDTTTVTDTSGTAQNNDTPTETTLTQSPAIAVVKTASVGGTGAVGDQITYTFDVTNTGNVTLSNVVIDDAKTASAALAVSPSTIAPGGTGTITATYTITQTDLNAGSVTNSATATGTAPNAATVSDTSGTAVTNDDDTVTNLTQSPAIAVVKTAAVGGTGAVGDQITYTFDVTNTGNVTLSNVVIDDAKTGSTALAVNPSTIAPGASGSITATYTITQADLNAGSVTNSATGTGTAPNAATVSDTSGTALANDDDTVTNLTQSPAIAVVKTASVGGTGAVGDQITYTFDVTNTGNVTLTNVVIDDAKTGSTALAVSPSTIAPGASGTITATYTITQADLNAGSVTNSATATGTAPNASTVSDTSGTATNNDDDTVTNLTQSPAIAVVKTASIGGTGSVGDQITYTFDVTNTGNVTLTNVVIDDAKTGSTALAV